MATTTQGKFSLEDQKLIDESIAKGRERDRKFFEFHKIAEPQLIAGDAAYKAFLNAEEKRGEKGFFNSPLGRKAFILGFSMGRAP